MNEIEKKTFKLNVSKNMDAISTTTYAGMMSIKEFKSKLIVKPIKQTAIELTNEEVYVLYTHIKRIVEKRKLMEEL